MLALCITALGLISWSLLRKKLKDKNTDVALVPAGLTGQLQPLDVSINKPFKERGRVLRSN